MANVSPEATASLQERIQALARFEPSPFPVVSLYLNLEPDERGRDRYEPFVRKVFAERIKSLPAHSSDRQSLEQDAERIQAYLREQVRPSANGVAVFACAGADEFFDALQLGTPFEQHWLFTGPVPHLYPLVRLADQYPRYAAVMLDTHQARIFVFGLNTVEGLATVTNEKSRRSSVGGWSQARYQRRADNLHLHHIKEVVDALDRLVTSERITKIVVIGHEVAVPLLRDQLPPRLAEMLVDVIRLNRSAGQDEVLQATLDALRQKDAETDAERVNELLDAWRGGGLAVVGAAATLEALERGQLEELIVSSTPQTLKTMPTTVELTAGPLAAETSEPQGPPPEEKLVLADELVTRAQQTSARVRFIEDPALLESVGGVGGLLRFRL